MTPEEYMKHRDAMSTTVTQAIEEILRFRDDNHYEYTDVKTENKLKFSTDETSLTITITYNR